MSRVAFRWRASVLPAVVVATALGCGRSSLNPAQDYETGGSNVAGDGGRPSFGGGEFANAGTAGTFSSLGGMAGVAGTFVTLGGVGAESGVAGGGMGGADPGSCSLSLSDCYTDSEPECSTTLMACQGMVLGHGIIWSTRVAYVTDIATAVDGRIAVGGWHRGLLNVDDATLPSVANGDDGFVLVFDNERKLLWSQFVGGPGAQAVTGVHFAPGGDLIVQGSTDPDPTSTAERPVGGGFLLRYDQQGREVWGYGVGKGPTQPGQVGVDNDGAITLVGGFKDTFAFRDLKQEANGYAPYVLHLDADANPKWLDCSLPDGWQGADASKLVVDDEDNLMVLGNGATTDNALVGYVRKLASNGSPVYLQQLRASENIDAGALAVDGKMRPVVGGNFRGSLSLGGATYKNRKKDVDDVWLAQLSREGEWSWVTTSPGAADGSSKLPALVTDPSGNIIASETSSEQLQVRKLRGSGAQIWNESFATLAPPRVALASSSGNVWLAASFAKLFQLGTTKIATQGESSVILLKLGR